MPVAGDIRNSGQQLDAVSSKRIYAGGFPYYVTDDAIHSFFEECGQIADIDRMTFTDSGKFRGIAILTFKTSIAAKRAIELDGAEMDSRYLRIKPFQQKQSAHPSSVEASSDALTKQLTKPLTKSEGCLTAYVGNLHWDVDETSLRSFFSDCKIKEVRLVSDEKKGHYCHVDFSDDPSLEKAVRKDQSLFLGRRVKVSYALPLRRGTQKWGEEAGKERSDDKTQSEKNSVDPNMEDTTEDGENERGGKRPKKRKQREERDLGSGEGGGDALEKARMGEAPSQVERAGKKEIEGVRAEGNERRVVEGLDEVEDRSESGGREGGEEGGKKLGKRGKARKNSACFVCGTEGHKSFDCPKKR